MSDLRLGSDGTDGCLPLILVLIALIVIELSLREGRMGELLIGCALVFGVAAFVSRKLPTGGDHE